MVNPAGHDVDREKVTVMKMCRDDVESLGGWRVQGWSNSALVFGDVSLMKGEESTIKLRASDWLQLGNSGSDVNLRFADGKTACGEIHEIKRVSPAWRADVGLKVFHQW